MRPELCASRLCCTGSGVTWTHIPDRGGLSLDGSILFGAGWCRQSWAEEAYLVKATMTVGCSLMVSGTLLGLTSMHRIEYTVTFNNKSIEVTRTYFSPNNEWLYFAALWFRPEPIWRAERSRFPRLSGTLMSVVILKMLAPGGQACLHLLQSHVLYEFLIARDFQRLSRSLAGSLHSTLPFQVP